MKKKICFLLSLSLFLFDCSSIFSSDFQKIVDKNVLYVHGFTGLPDGWKKMVPAILPDSNVIAPLLPDAQPVKGFGMSKLLYLVGSLWGKKINRLDSDMGHDKDVEVIISKIPDKPFVGYGICRGGTALINAVAKHNPQHLKALVIESTYASLPKMLYGFLSSYGISTKYAESFAKALFPSYEIGSVCCQKAIASIKNKNLPVLILHSQDDVTIPLAHAWMLYKTFKEHGFEHVYLVELKGSHAFGLRDDKDAYLRAVHSFYKKYDLAYEAEYATADMNSYVPSVARVTEKLTLYYEKIKKNTQRNRAEMYNYSVGKMIIVAARLQKQPSKQ
jgi:pimeloyl-ACP methyl ester carboxylesterase